MSFLDIILLAIGVSMDAFAVSIAKGLATQQLRPKHYLSVALWFGGFQALMTLAGYFAGFNFTHIVESFDHWISFFLLGLLGVGMIREAMSKDEEAMDASFAAKNMLIMAIATSIDALAVGVSLSFEEVNIWFAALLIGLITLLLSAVGLKIGNIFGNRYKTIAGILGGVMLICIGVKILITHLFL
jgi:putative Mn2+ efflux pump MntP